MTYRVRGRPVRSFKLHADGTSAYPVRSFTPVWCFHRAMTGKGMYVKSRLIRKMAHSKDRVIRHRTHHCLAFFHWYHRLHRVKGAWGRRYWPIKGGIFPSRYSKGDSCTIFFSFPNIHHIIVGITACTILILTMYCVGGLIRTGAQAPYRIFLQDPNCWGYSEAIFYARGLPS